MPDLPTTRDRDGNLRVLGCLPRTLTKPDGLWFPVLAEDKLLPEESWREYDAVNGPILEQQAQDTPFIWQGQVGSCCPSAGGGGIQICNFREGEEVERLAESSVYAWSGATFDGEKWRLVPRRDDSGMAVDTCCLLLRLIGMAPRDETGENGIPSQDWRGAQRTYDKWKGLADNHRLTEWLDNISMKHLMHQLVSGRPVVHGYDRHARLAVRPQWRGSEVRPYRFKLKNSWPSEPWHYLNWAQMESGIYTYGCFSPLVTVAG